VLRRGCADDSARFPSCLSDRRGVKLPIPAKTDELRSCQSQPKRRRRINVLLRLQRPADRAGARRLDLLTWRRVVPVGADRAPCSSSDARMPLSWHSKSIFYHLTAFLDPKVSRDAAARARGVPASGAAKLETLLLGRQTRRVTRHIKYLLLVL
jgi:hypothetical protein